MLAEWAVSDACQIKDLDHVINLAHNVLLVSDACQIKDLDHVAVAVVAS